MADEKNGTTDLMSDEDSGNGGSDKKKPAKAPKQAKQPKPAKEPAPKPEPKAKSGKKKGGKLKVILVIVLLLLIAGFVFEEIYYNYLGTRSIIINAVVRLDPDFTESDELLDDKRAELAELETQLTSRERTAASREAQNVRRSEELARWEQELSDLENWLLPLYRRQMTTQELEDMESLSISYSRMSPESAADRLTELAELSELDDVAAILYFMNERNAAAILASMEPDFAAEITKILLYK